MTTDNQALIRKVADLARLELTPEEVQTFAQQIGDVLGYVKKLEGVDVAGVEPLTYPFDSGAELREDIVIPGLKSEDGHPKVLKSAPESLYDGYKVPPII